MWFLPLGSSTTSSDIAVSNTATDEFYPVTILPRTTASPVVKANVKPVNYVPPTPVLSGTGGTLSVSTTFRTHSYTADGASSWVLAQVTPFDPYA